MTKKLTTRAARKTLLTQKPESANSVEELADTWHKLMPIDDRKRNFPVRSVNEETAFTEIHIHCPLRGTGDTEACYRLMNYDRTLMENVGGQLVVIESQADPKNTHCKLAIRVADASISDLVPAHVNDSFEHS